MKKLLLSLGLMAVLAQSALAFRPSGWVYSNYPWAYDSGSRDWYWFNTADTQWIANMGNSQWSRLPNSAMASGWVYFEGDFAYAQGNSAWHWINAADTQWVVNMRTGIWSRFGENSVPSDLVLIPAGTNSGTDPESGAYSLTVDSFYIGRHEVTKALWDEIYSWAIANGYSFDNTGSGKAAAHPVHTVNWYDAVKWCNARSEKEGKRPIYYYMDGEPLVYRTGQRDLASVMIMPGEPGYALPTGGQWEYAARGGVANRRFPWGDSDEIQHYRANYLSPLNLSPPVPGEDHPPLFSYDTKV